MLCRGPGGVNAKWVGDAGSGRARVWQKLSVTSVPKMLGCGGLIARRHVVFVAFLPHMPTSPKPFFLRLGEFVKFSHTVFALPFALMAALVASGGHIAPRLLALVLVCMVTARTAAMCFNRLADWEIDKKNPRTARRHTLIRKEQGWAVLFISLAALFTAAWMINPLCFYLSPGMVAVILSYSLMKRYTAFPHFFLGLALGIAPLGAWAAVAGELFSTTPYLLAAAVLCWTFGFDLIYATLDVEFDRSVGLFSFPAKYGVPSALRLARLLHYLAFAGFVAFGWAARLGYFYGFACLVAVAGLVQEHRLARQADAAAINKAFFQSNAVVSLSLLAGVFLDIV